MKKYICRGIKPVSLFILFSFYGNAQKMKCSDFRVGQFEYSEPAYSDWKVTRTDSIQIEINSEIGVEIRGTIKWISDCEYVLKYTEIINAEGKDIINKAVEVQIINTTPKGYIFRSKSYGVEIESEMIKIK